MGFSTNLKNLRAVNNVTQNDLAKVLKVSRPTIAGYETKNRQPDFNHLIKISDYFGVSIDYLITGSEKSPINITATKKISEKSVDNDVLTAYQNLTLESKQDVLKYIQLLQLKERSTVK